VKILITGAKGQVGWELTRQAPLAGFDLLALDADGLDITDAQAIQRVLAESAIDGVINAAAYTAVDRAEQQSEQAYAVNRDGPAYLAAACTERGIPLLHLSTDYVFAGDQTRPYREDDPVSPLGVYGQSKWAGEQAVRQTLSQHVILRTSWVFGVHGHNFVKTMLRLAQEREHLRVVADQHGSPTFAGDIAAALLHIIAHPAWAAGLAWGTYHFTGSPPTTWHDLATAAIEQARRWRRLPVQAITPITTADYPTPAARPLYSVLDTQRFAQVFGYPSPSWQPGLAQLVKQEYVL
jgi:dTDP-4-dehydrorhamnose reductase